MQAYPRPDWTFRPTSKADFSERSKNVARLLQQPLQKTQEFLSRVFGYSDLHALQAEIQRVESDPENHPPGPFMDAMFAAFWGERHPAEMKALQRKGVRFAQPAERDNHLLSATAEFCLGDPTLNPEPRHWDMREIDLFDTLDRHRVSFARIRKKWRLLDATRESAPQPASDMDAGDYARLATRPSGRRVLQFTPVGQAVNDACLDLVEKLSWNLSPSEKAEAYRDALKGLERVAMLHPRNPWAMSYVISVAREGRHNPEAYLRMASTALEMFSALYAGEPEKALPRNFHCGPDVDNRVFHFLLFDGQGLALDCDKPRIASKFKALERKVSMSEPLTEEEEIAALVNGAMNASRRGN